MENEKEQQNLENNSSLEEKRKFRHFLYFFSGQQISILGSSVVSFVLIWWITEITQSELMLGLASLCSLGPFLLVAPFSGVIADKANKKRLLLLVDALQALFTVILTIIFMVFYNPNNPQENLTLLITSIFITLGLRGAMQAFHSPIVSAMTPTMVPEKHLSRMNGIGYLLNGIINIGGPAIGAVLLSFIGVSLTLWIDIITFAIAVIPLILIKIPSVIKETTQEKVSFFTEFKEGFTVMRSIKGLLPVIFTATLINFFFSPVSTLLPMFVNKVHGGTETDYALVIGILQAGVIVGGLFMALFKGFNNKIRTAIFCVLMLFIGQSVLIFVPTTMNARFWMIGVILFLTILTNPAANVSFSTALQVIVPKDKMGRVFSVLMFFSQAIVPLGNFLSGLIGEYVPLGILFTSAGVLGIVVTLMMYFLTSAKHLDKEILRITAENGIKEIDTEFMEVEPSYSDESSESAIPSINLDTKTTSSTSQPLE